MEVIDKIDVQLDLTPVVLGVENFESIVNLRRITFANLKHKDNYVVEDDESRFILDHLGEFGASIGFFHEGELIAYTAISYDIISCNSFDEYKLLIGNNKPINQFGAFAATVIHPDFQGKGIHAKAIHYRLLLAKKKQVKYLTASISPHNKESLNNIINAGGEIRFLNCFSDSRKRFLLILDVNKTDSENSFTEVYVPLRKISLHDKILNEGYYGNNIIKTGFDSYVSYVKDKPTI